MSKESVRKDNEEGKETDTLTVTEPNLGEEMVTDSGFGANSMATIERDKNNGLKDSDAGYKDSTTSDKDKTTGEKCQSTVTTTTTSTPMTQKLYLVKNPLPSKSSTIASTMGFPTIQAAVPSVPVPGQIGSTPGQTEDPSTSGRVEPQSVLIFFKQKQCQKEYAERKEKILKLLPSGDLKVSTLQELDSKLAEIKSTGVSGGNIGPFKRMAIVPKDDSLAYCIPVMV